MTHRFLPSLFLAAVLVVGCSGPQIPELPEVDAAEALEDDAGMGVDQAVFADEPDVVLQVAADLELAAAEGRVTDLFTQASLDELEAAGGDLTALLPEDAVLDVQVKTWQRTGNIADVAADVTAEGSTDAFVLVLVRDPDGQWLISYTQPITGQ